MSESMMAALLYGVGDLRVEETGRPAIAEPDEVLIRIRACGICPSDLRGYTGVRAPYRELPYILGHEWAGEVVAVGEGVQGYAVGERVVPSWRVPCGRCHYCIRGHANYCENLRHGVRGGFAEYGVACTSSLLRMPDRVSYQEACFCEPLACCLNGNRQSGISTGQTVAVLGAGPIGLLHLQLAKRCGARAIVSDPLEERLDKAAELGADELVHAGREDAVARVKALTGGHGADVVIVAAGSARAAEQALAMADLCASVNLFAGTYPATTIALDPNLIHYKQLRLTGSHDYSPLDFEHALQAIELGMVKVAPLISHELPLAETRRGFDIVAAQVGLKVVVNMDL